MKYAYDETPLKCRLQTDPDELAESMVMGKIYVIEVSWKVSVRIDTEDAQKTLFFFGGGGGGHFSPILRPLEPNSGRNIAAMLRQVPGAPPLAHSFFPLVLRIKTQKQKEIWPLRNNHFCDGTSCAWGIILIR